MKIFSTQTLIFLGILIMLYGCTNSKPPVKSNQIAIPVKVETIKPTIKDINSGNKQSTVIVQDQKHIIKNQQEKIDRLQAELVSIVEQLESGKVPKKESIEKIIDELNLVKKDNEHLTAKNIELLDQLEKQALSIQDAIGKISDVEAQNADLILRLTSANKIIEEGNLTIENLNDDLIEARQKAERNVVYRNWVLGIVACIGLFFLIKTIIKAYNPFM